MRRIGTLVIVMLLCFWPAFSQAFLCNGKDLGCFASWILPGNQVNTENIREWSASEGHVVGKDGNIIEFKLKFDSQSFETLRHNFKWYSKANILLDIKGLGLEIDICDPGNILRFDYVESTFPSSARATIDTDLSDSINSCKNAMGLLVKNPAALKEGKDYYVRFYLKDQIPSGGVTVKPSLQISADTRLLENASPLLGYAAMFDELLLGGYREKFEYFAVESDVYFNPMIYPNEIGGLCWTSKSYSGPCQNYNSDLADVLLPTNRELLPRYFGVTTLPYGYLEPLVELNPPDFIVRKSWLETPWGIEVYKYGNQEEIKMKAQFKNIGEGDTDKTIEAHAYLSKGYKEDPHSGDKAWRRVGTDYIKGPNLKSGDTQTETEGLTIREVIDEPGIYNIVWCIDHIKDDHNNGGAIQEKHESNNCSTETVFEVTADARLNFQTFDFTANSFRFLQAPKYAGDQARFGANVINIGSSNPPSNIRSSYSVQCPGTGMIQLADDGTEASQLTPNVNNWEQNDKPVTMPNAAGNCTAFFCTDYQNAVQEDNESNNCTSFPFYLQPRPAPILSIAQFKDQKGCCTTNTGDYVYPNIWVKNTGSAAPASNVSVIYQISSPNGTGGNWWTIGYGTIESRELPPGGTDEDYMDGNRWQIPKNNAWKNQWHTVRACLRRDGGSPKGDPSQGDICASYTRFSKK